MKVIIYADHHENILLAAQAARWLSVRPDQRDAVLCYGETKTIEFYVSRTKSKTIVAREIRRA